MKPGNETTVLKSIIINKAGTMTRGIVLAAALAFLFLNCTGNPASAVPSRETNSDYVSYVQEFDYPTVAIYTIYKDSVFCDTGFLLKKAWVLPTMDSDFDSLSALIIRKSIYGMPDPVVPQGTPRLAGCAGHAIEYRIGTMVDTVNIVCQSNVPVVLAEVVDSVWSKVNKYLARARLN
jgi:hypothetical protein